MPAGQYTRTLDQILQTAEDGKGLNAGDVRFLLNLTRKKDREQLFHAARKIRQRFFNDHVFLYGFIYFSTYCRNNCRFCQFQRSNTNLLRYRKSAVEIYQAAHSLAAAGVHLIDLTMGEDPAFFNNNPDGFGKLVNLASEVKKSTKLPVMVSPGIVPDTILADLAAAGVAWYACYQETHNRDLFSRLRTGQDFELRLEKKITARKWGMLIEEGILIGVGESLDDIVDSIMAMQAMNADQIRAMSYVPHEEISIGAMEDDDPERELLVISILRLMNPNQLIPASLDVKGLDGLKNRLNAGANVITSLVPPGEGWSGVANQTLDIEEARRTPGAVKPILAELGLRVARLEEYRDWMAHRHGIVTSAARQSKIG